MKTDLTAGIPGGPDNLLVRTREDTFPARRRSPKNSRRQNSFQRKFPVTSCGLRPPGQQVVRATQGNRTEALTKNSMQNFNQGWLT